MCHTHTTHFACTHTHTHLELCCLSLKPLVVAAVVSGSSRGPRHGASRGEPTSFPLPPSPSSSTRRSTPTASSSSYPPSTSSPWSPNLTTPPLTPPSTAPDPSPPPPFPRSTPLPPQPHRQQHKTTHTTAPSASVCVNCTGPPLEYPFPYPFQRRQHGGRIPDLDVFDLAGTMSAWDDDDDDELAKKRRTTIPSPSSSSSHPPKSTDPGIEHLARTLTVSVALPLRHDPYADGEAAPDVAAVPFVARVKAAPPPPPPPPPPTSSPPTCPKAPRLRPVRVDDDGERGAGSAGAQGRDDATGEIEGLSLDGDGDDDGDDEEGVVEAAVGVSLKTQQQQAGARKGERREKEGRDDGGGGGGGRHKTTTTAGRARGGRLDDHAGAGDAATVPGLAKRLWQDRHRGGGGGGGRGSAHVSLAPRKGEDEDLAGKSAARTTRAKL
ncbi:uncharacterized protein BKA78DRAFT_43715 [Phyllosticta capitalensis]|uniref:uncharacterized protein n=1 Tax=Phyllosticta capitalensis TaxID=121624 RepID=UPI00312FE42A